MSASKNKFDMENILITGGTGLIGTRLCQLLLQKGYSVSILSRSRKKIKQVKSYIWDVKSGEIDSQAIQNADYIIHLAGENIGDIRWTAKAKEEIKRSREKSTALLYQTIKTHNPKLKAFISSSAVGYYGLKKTQHVFSEEDTNGDDFLASVCYHWENDLRLISALQIRTAIIRTGIVFSNRGGAFPKLLQPIKLGLIAALGNGEQYMPWIHIDDICNLYILCIEDSRFVGVFNGVGLEHTTNRALIQKIAQHLKRKIFLPDIPSFLIHTVLGEKSQIVLKGNKISAAKIQKFGFKHQYGHLELALKNLLN